MAKDHTFPNFFLPLASIEVISALVVLICPTDYADYPMHTFPSAKTYQNIPYLSNQHCSYVAKATQ